MRVVGAPRRPGRLRRERDIPPGICQNQTRQMGGSQETSQPPHLVRVGLGVQISGDDRATLVACARQLAGELRDLLDLRAANRTGGLPEHLPRSARPGSESPPSPVPATSSHAAATGSVWRVRPHRWSGPLVRPAGMATRQSDRVRAGRRGLGGRRPGQRPCRTSSESLSGCPAARADAVPTSQRLDTARGIIGRGKRCGVDVDDSSCCPDTAGPEWLRATSMSPQHDLCRTCGAPRTAGLGQFLSLVPRSVAHEAGFARLGG